MKTTRLIFVIATSAVFLLTACGGQAPAQPAPADQPSVVEPAAPAPAEPAQPAEPVEPPPPPEPAQPEYAPFCDTAPAGCEAPTVEMRDNKYCIDKVPYAIMAVPVGTTYESLDDDMMCVDQIAGDEMRISCHSVTSKQLWSYDLKVCNSACAAPALQMDTGQCPDGYGYDPANTCCAAPEPSGSDGCITYQVDLGACPDPQ